MKQFYQLFICFFILIGANAQEETIEINMGPGYQNEVYFKLDSQNQNIFEASLWDIAFYRESNFDLGVRVNDGVGITVYEVANTPAGYNNVDISNQSEWVILYNSETEWKNGAFMQGSATYGWGEYNPTTNEVEGTIVFVLEYADGSYRKLFIESYFGEYNFKYSTWNNGSWSSDITATVSNTSNPDRSYNYYSLINESELIGEPAATEWDFVFRKYITYLQGAGQYYPVTGALSNTSVTIAQIEETGDPDPNNLEYNEEMNIIGYDWKSFAGTWEVFPDKKFYIKYDNNQVYRIYFTDFEGTSSGNLTFQMEEVSELLGSNNQDIFSFGIYPNPSSDRLITLLYDQGSNFENSRIIISDLTGKVVYENKLISQSGFYQKTLDLNGLQSGIYLVNLNFGDQVISKRLILN